MNKEKECPNYKPCQWGFCMYHYNIDNSDCKKSCKFEKFNKTKEDEGENNSKETLKI